MKNEFLVQKKFLKERRFRTSRIGVEVYTRNGLSETTYTVPYSEIMENPIEEVDYSKFWAYLWGISVFVLVIDFVNGYLIDGEFHRNLLFITGLVSVISSMYFYMSYDKNVFYAAGRFPLCFLKDNPRYDSVEYFMTCVFREQDSYMEQKYRDLYFSYGSHLTGISIPDELYKLRRLHEAEVISEAEHEVSKRKLLGLEVNAETESKQDSADSRPEVHDEKM